MPTIVEMLHSAVRHHQSGQYQQAELLYRQILQVDPNQADALHLLGVIASQVGKHQEAVRYIQAAIRVNPNEAAFYSNLGASFKGLGVLSEASAAYQKALQLRPEFAEAHHNLGNVHLAQKQYDQALVCYREAVRLKPDYAEAHNNQGRVLFNLERVDEATASFQEAIRLRPPYAEPHNQLGRVYLKLDRLPEAMAEFQEAIRLKPDYAEAHYHLGYTLHIQGQIAESLGGFQAALRIRPDYADAHLGRALVWLMQGDYEQAWPEYEWRWKHKDMSVRVLAKPRWDGAPLAGRTLLVHCEQGLGDTLEFIRYATLPPLRGGRVLVECQPALAKLLATCPGIDQLVPQGTPLPPFDVHVPLLSLPGVLGTTFDTVPAPVPYLSPEPALVEQWRGELAGTPRLKVGIAWRGSKDYARDRYRSIPLREFEPLARVEGVTLFSLQKGAGCEELGRVGFPVVDWTDRLDVNTGPFQDTAALMKNLDLVVAADTGIGHLAGALGVPVWIALCKGADWRWVVGRDDTPWYPTMRLFWQPEFRDWPAVFGRMAEELRRRQTTPGPLVRPASRPIRVEIAPGELIDKITILEIKDRRMTDAAKLAHVRAELALLAAARDRALPRSVELDRLTAELRQTNEAIWEVEDEIRLCEQRQDFGQRFVELARSVYRSNDRRSALKRRINELLDAALVEEKEHPVYERPDSS